MIDPRLEKPDKILIDYSVAVEPGDNVLVQGTGIELGYDKAPVKAVHRVGARAFSYTARQNTRQYVDQERPGRTSGDAGPIELNCIKQMDCFIGFNAWRNLSPWYDLSGDEPDLYNKNI